jgi:hypothetical protein
VHDKARVQGSMASIVKWQAYKMQEYRFQLLIGLASFLELFGLGPRRPAFALVGSRSVQAPKFRTQTMIPAAIRMNTANSANAGIIESRKETNMTIATDIHLPPRIVRHRIIVPINGIHQGTLTALRYAHSLSNDVTAVHIEMDQKETMKLQQQWGTWGEGVRLVTVESPHNMVLEPLLEYIQKLMSLRQENEIITVVVPQSIRPRWWTNLMRTQIGVLLRLSLPFETGIVITDVPYSLENEN